MAIALTLWETLFMIFYGVRKVIPTEMYNEAMDYCEWKNGYRTEGMTSVAQGLAQKLSSIVSSYLRELSETATAIHAVSVTADCSYEESIIPEMSALLGDAYRKVRRLDEALMGAKTVEGSQALANYYRDKVFSAMAELRITINQRGQEVYTRTSGQHIYTVDRWMAYGCSSVAREANTSPAVTPYQLKIGLANPGQSTFLQPIENFEALTGSTISISFWIKADAEEQFNVIFGLDANPITAATTWKEFKFAIPSVQIGAFVTHGLCLQTVSNTPAATYYQFAAPQVVFGSATDQYHIPDPSLEMVRCRRYFYSLNSSKSRYAMVGQGYARWSDLTLVGVPVTLAVPMRIQAPIVTMSGTIGTMGLPNVINAISVESYYSTENIMRLRFKMNGELEANTCYEIAARNDADANITLDAEIYA